MIAELTREELPQLFAGSLHLDCTQISLSGRRDGQPETYSGPGYIRQVEGEGFVITIFVAGRLNLRTIFGQQFVKPGVLFGEDRQYVLEATDVRGRTWAASRIINPQPGGDCSATGYVVEARCDELVLRGNDPRPVKAPSYVELHAQCETPFPRTHYTTTTTAVGQQKQEENTSLNLARVSCLGFDFRISQDGQEFYLRATATSLDTPLHPHFESRIWEALLFVLGPIPWSASTRVDSGRTITHVRSPPQTPHRGLRPLPIAFRLIDESGSVWRLFELYLKYVLNDAEASFAPLSAHILSVSRSSGGSVEAQALSLVVAVESLLDEFYHDVGKPDERTSSLVDELVERITQWRVADPVDQLVETVRRRAAGSVGEIKRSRAGDRLKVLLSEGVVSDEGVRAWKGLRNSAAHGDWSGARDDLQGFLDRTGKARVLFFQLVFHLVGYRGPQTDYGTHGYPEIPFPPVRPSANGPGADDADGPDPSGAC